MASETVDVDEAQSRLPELVTKAASGTEVIIAEGGTPRARLVAVNPPLDVRPRRGRVPGLHRGAVAYISEDFDAPLPDDFWLSEETEPA